ncbi:MAG: DNA-binding protein [Candidatus Diapherotrites archaeon]|nr:DNA-binding protein [Candidatus Diapherotrites archaeon]
MNVKDLSSGQGKIDIELEIVSMAEPRPFANARGEGKVANAAGKDSEGNEIKITLWNEQCDLVKEGNKIKIENGYVSEYKGEKQLSTGKFGKLTVLE